MITRIVLLLFFFAVGLTMNAQYPPAAGQPGSTAIHQDSSVITSWATHCQIHRGWYFIEDTTFGPATYGAAMDAVGKANNQVVSLGDGGSAILTFAKPIIDGPGWDFVVYENALNENFLELAFVEVSEDGINYTRFPAHSLIQTDTQCNPFGQTDPTLINNLAGKYKVEYGTPFDLANLPKFLNIKEITHIKIIDVVGSIDTLYGTRDSAGNVINDPYPTAFASSGFDLDGVGVIHQLVGLEELEMAQLKVWPNPAQNTIQIRGTKQGTIQLVDLRGKIVLTQVYQGSQINISVETINRGLYILMIRENNHQIITKKVILH